MSVSKEEIDERLPQTQCGLCGYGGCMPYAKAMAEESAPINLCPPGGIPTLRALGELLEQDIEPFIDEMQKKAKAPMIASIREKECIGCTKCINACPVDAIIGSAKTMHVIISDRCTGCELCIPPCPVDCIDLLQVAESASLVENKEKRMLARLHFNRRETRLKRESTHACEQTIIDHTQKTTQLRSYIADALNRTKKK